MINRIQEDIMQNWGTSNSDQPLVSIKCMTYNHEKYIAQALEGFLMQETNFPFEILVHDDASNDKTADVIRAYEEKFPKIIKPIYETENQWSKGNRAHHKQIDAMIKGKYIAVCEGDDFWTDPNKLQMQVDFLESHPDYSMCFHGAAIKYDDNLYTQAECESIQDKDYSADELLNHWTVPTASIVMRRECVDYPIKNRSAIVYGDYFAVFSCLALGKVRGFSKSMSTYRVNGNSITYNPEYRIKTILKMPENWECFKENFPFVPKKSINRTLAFHYWQRAKIQPNLKLSFQDRKKAFSLSPIFSFMLIFRPFYLAVLDLLSKHFNTTKLSSCIKKMISHV